MAGHFTNRQTIYASIINCVFSHTYKNIKTGLVADFMFKIIPGFRDFALYVVIWIDSKIGFR